MKCNIRSRASKPFVVPSGLSRVEVLIALLVVMLLGAIAVPAVQTAREMARLNSCHNNLRQLGVGFAAYHEAHQSLMPAAVWNGRRLRSLALHQSKRHDLFVHHNWAQTLLPFVGEEQLAASFNPALPLANESHAGGRTTVLPLMNCPADEFNRPDNPYVFQPTDNISIEYARGNYAINGGSQSQLLGPGNTSSPHAEAAWIVMDSDTREFRYWGNGVAGFNRSFSFSDFRNGLSTLVIVDEIRAGIHAIDPRGVWALGHIASSVTSGHGATGDDYCPNNQWGRAEDIQGCGALHDLLGTQTLFDLEMPCVSYVDINQQATARSRHAAGANVLFADGRARFVSNSVDPGVWHVIHSRETPADVLSSEFEEYLKTTNFREAVRASVPHASAMDAGHGFENSIGMKFVVIPAGKFTMGVPDKENDAPLPPECPMHDVHITRPFLLGAFEVTRHQFHTVMGSTPNPSVAEEADRRDDKTTEQLDTSNEPAAPVSDVTWFDAVKFCRTLSELPDERDAGRRYRLPTEAEWEYACRSGKSDPYAWSKQRAADDRSGEAAGIQPALPITPVGSYPPNAFGLYDMRGNVWEWCSDWFDRDYYTRSPVADPQGPSHGFLKVVRGGDWTFVGETCRINYPMNPPWNRSPFIGFRVVCESQQTSK